MSQESKKPREKRSDKVTVIMPSDLLTPEDPDNPEDLTIDLKRTKKYVEQMLSRPIAEVWKEVNDQMTILLLSMREASLKWLELWTNSKDPKVREEAKHHFVTLSREAAGIAEQRASLAKATGLNLVGEVGETEAATLPTLYDPKPMSPEEFERTFLPLVPTPVVTDMRVIEKK